MRQKRDRTVVLLLAAGLLVALDRVVDPMTLVALTAVALGVHRASVLADGVGYAAIAVGTILLLVLHWPLFAALAASAAVFFYSRARAFRKSSAAVRFGGFVRSLTWERSPYVLRDTWVLSAVGEARIDLSLAMAERPETTVTLEGGVGDVRLVVPDDWEVEVEAFAVFGKLRAEGRQAAGLWNRFAWRSPGWAPDGGTGGPRLKLVVRYIVADVEIIRM